MRKFIFERNEQRIEFYQVKDKHALNIYTEICRSEDFLDQREPYPESSVPYYICACGQRVGYLSLDKTKNGDICLWGLYIKPQYRQRGLAETSLLKVIKRLRLLEMPSLYCYVVPTNEVAVHLYEKYGYYQEIDGALFEPQFSNKLRRVVNDMGDHLIVFFARDFERNYYNMRDTICRRIYNNDLKKYSNKKPKLVQA